MACLHQSLNYTNNACECGDLEILLVTSNNASVAFCKAMHAIKA